MSVLDDAALDAVTSSEERERQERALVLRKQGKTGTDIANELGFSSATEAYQAAQVALRRTKADNKDEQRNLELARLDDLIKGLWGRAKAGDLNCIDRVLKIMERRAKLLGLDQPTQTAITNADGTEDLVSLLTDEERTKRIRILIGLEA